MKFNVNLDNANLCILLVKMMTNPRGPVMHELGKILLNELTDRFENGVGGLEHELDITDYYSYDVGHAVVALEDISEQASQELKEFLEMIVSGLHADQLSRK